MATTNLGLTKLDGTEKLKTFPTTFNGDMDDIDAAFGAAFGGSNSSVADVLGAVQDAIAIVANGNTHAAVAAGQYVYVKNHGSLADGLYKATAAISANATLSGSNLTADGSGGLNALKTIVDNKVKTVLTENLSSYTGATLVQYVSNLGESIHITSASGANRVSDFPVTQAGTYIIMPGSYYANIIFVGTDGSIFCYRSDSSTWVMCVGNQIEILNEYNNFTAGETKSANCDWKPYKSIRVAIGNYGNIYQTVDVSTTYFNTTNSGNKIFVNWEGHHFGIYKKSDTEVYIEAPSSSLPANTRIRIYGCS